MADTRPNILFFFTDQQRWDTCGCYGQDLPVTPELDKMAKDGVLFNNAFTCQPVCGPARACLQTGKYATEIGVYTNGIPLPLDEYSLASRMNDAGYETGYIGKWHLASGGDEDHATTAVPEHLRGGYKDYWVASDVLEFTSHGYGGHMFDKDGNKVEWDETTYRVDAQTDHVIDFLETRSGDKPWFLFTSYIEPHHQNDRNTHEGPHGSKEKFKDYEVPGDLVDTEGDWRESYPDYLGCCNSLDNALARVRKKLKQQGILDNTVIIFTSDHGSHFKTRNGEYKRSCHDGCTHIPMVICGPGFEGGKHIDEMASLIDLPATVVKAAGIEPPAEFSGHALQSVAEGMATDWADDVFIQISESQIGRAVRTHKWKYSVAVDTGEWTTVGFSDEYTEQFLYDLENDPHERNNLVADPKYSDVRADMQKRLRLRMSQVGEKDPVIIPA